jgi:hypothetical protein
MLLLLLSSALFFVRPWIQLVEFWIEQHRALASSATLLFSLHANIFSTSDFPCSSLRDYCFSIWTFRKCSSHSFYLASSPSCIFLAVAIFNLVIASCSKFFLLCLFYLASWISLFFLSLPFLASCASIFFSASASFSSCVLFFFAASASFLSSATSCFASLLAFFFSLANYLANASTFSQLLYLYVAPLVPPLP